MVVLRRKDCPAPRETLGIWGARVGCIKAPWHEWLVSRTSGMIPGRGGHEDGHGWLGEDACATGTVLQCEGALISHLVVEARCGWICGSSLKLCSLFAGGGSVPLVLFYCFVFPVPEHFRGTKFPHGQTTPSLLHFDS